MVSASTDIAKIFREYYTALYNLTPQTSPTTSGNTHERIRQYLESSGMPSLSDDVATDLDLSISTD